MKILLVFLFVTTSVFAKNLTHVSVKLDSGPVLTREAVKGLLASKNANGRIVGGNVAANGQFPFYLLIITNGNTFCGSSLLAATWVITAAHCLVGQSSGSVYSIMDLSVGYTWTSVINELVYLTYEGENGYAVDFAMARLQDAATVSDSINFIALPTSDDNTFAGYSATLAGFGDTSDSGGISNVLKYLTTTVIENSQCSQYYSGINSTNLCTLSPAGQSGCAGDSGDGLFVGDVNDHNGRILIGIVNFGNGAGCELGSPVGYLRVSSFLSFINNFI